MRRTGNVTRIVRRFESGSGRLNCGRPARAPIPACRGSSLRRALRARRRCRAAPTSSRRSRPSTSTSRPTASTAPSSGARSTALGTEMVAGNRARLLENGDGHLSARCSRRSRRPGSRSTWRSTSSTTARSRAASREALAERARAGVEVRILVDGFGSNLGPLEPELDGGGRARPRLQAAADLLDRPRRQPDPPADPDHRRPDRVLRRRRDRRPLEGRRAQPLRVARHDDPHRGAGRRPAAAHLRAGLGPHDRRGPQRRSAVSRRSIPAGHHARAGHRGRPRRRDLDVEARPLHGDPGGAPAASGSRTPTSCRTARSARASCRPRGAAWT